jgi:hypothetical protein
MGALLAGIDFSSKAIHCALIPLDENDTETPPVTLRHYDLPTWKAASTTPAYRSVERCRLVGGAVVELCDPFSWRTLLAGYGSAVVRHACIEEPFGSHGKADNVLRELYGAILASIPPHIERDTITTQEWRRIAFGGYVSEDWKETAILRAMLETGIEVNEHSAEAYLIARACRKRLNQSVAA